MGPNEDRIRDEMAQAADTARGLGGMLGTADLAHYSERLDYAAMDDARFRAESCRDCEIPLVVTVVSEWGGTIETDGERYREVVRVCECCGTRQVRLENTCMGEWGPLPSFMRDAAERARGIR